MEEFKKIEDYPVVEEIDFEDIMKYDDYIKQAQENSKRNAIDSWQKSKNIVLN